MATNVKGRVFGAPEMPVKGSTTIAAGDIIVSAAGYMEPGKTATSLKVWGIAQKDVDNSTGSDGDAVVVVETSFPKSGGREFFWLKNDANGTPADATDVGSVCYVLNATTITMDSTGASKCGTVVRYDAVNDLVGVLFDQ